MIRRIMHVDMDAFYAGIEQSDRPELKGKPVIVGGSRRGVVSAASYEARKYGVHSAMPIFQARRLCPKGIFLPVRMARYKEVSRQVMEVLAQVSPLVEIISIDEATIDITGTESLHGPPDTLASNIKRAIQGKTSLTCSIGIAPNRFLAKIASDMNKPDGLTILSEADVPEFLHSLPIQKIPGIGAKSAQMFKDLGVNTASDILKFPLSFWTRRMGEYAASLYEKAQGKDPSLVTPSTEPKSCSAEDTFPEDTADHAAIEKWLYRQAQSVGRDLRKEGFLGRTITLKVKYADFKTVTRSRTLQEPMNCTQLIFASVKQLLYELRVTGKVRLTGVGVSNFSTGLKQVRLFRDSISVKQENLDHALDEICARFGEKALKTGRIFEFEP